MTWALRSSETTAGVYEHPAGHRDLRVAIARHIGISRGIRASADDIIVTNGTQQALDVLARVLLAPGDGIAVEDPSYGPPRQLFKALGIRVVGVPVDRQGLVVDALPRGIRAVYVTPSHQYPLSVTMTLPRRQALLAWAERNNAAIIEDDYDSEFRFGGRPLEPLQTLDAKGRVVYVGSFSKTMLPTLRLGFLVTPPSLRAALHKAKFVSDWHSSTLAQAALARFIDEGAFARHVRRVSAIYRERHQILADAISRDFAEHLELIPSTTGLHLTALARRMSADADRRDRLPRRRSRRRRPGPVTVRRERDPTSRDHAGLWRHSHGPHRRRDAFAPRLFRQVNRGESKISTITVRAAASRKALSTKRPLHSFFASLSPFEAFRLWGGRRFSKPI